MDDNECQAGGSDSQYNSMHLISVYTNVLLPKFERNFLIQKKKKEKNKKSIQRYFKILSKQNNLCQSLRWKNRQKI